MTIEKTNSAKVMPVSAAARRKSGGDHRGKPAREHRQHAADDERDDRAFAQHVMHVEADFVHAVSSRQPRKIAERAGKIGGAKQHPTAHDREERIKPARPGGDAGEKRPQAQAFDNQKRAVPGAPQDEGPVRAMPQRRTAGTP